MDTFYQRCCGMDIHKKLVVACLITPGPKGKPGKEIRSFGTMTADLLELSDWLGAAGCTHVAMESTGVYWKPIYNIWEGSFELLLVNARHIKTVPGRKTDVKDWEWIAELLQPGLLRGSFVPQQGERELGEVTRYRSSLVRERTAEINRLQKTWEGANIKLASVASEVTGVSGRAMLQALVAGNTDAKALAQLAKGQLRNKIPQLERALAGQFGPHQRFLVAPQLAHIDFLDQAIEQVSQEVGEGMRPFEADLEHLDPIPGLGQWTAEVIVAEIGTDMSRFPSAGQLSSWAGMGPGNNESAGKRKSGKTGKGSKWLRVALTEAAYAAGRGQGTYLSSQYHRLAARRGRKKAAIAVGHPILVIAYPILDRHTTYQDLGPEYFDHRQSTRLRSRLVNRLQGLGYDVSLTPLPQAA